MEHIFITVDSGQVLYRIAISAFANGPRATFNKIKRLIG